MSAEMWPSVRPLIPWLITSVSLGYCLYIHCKLNSLKRKQQTLLQPINPYIDKHKPKVKHVFRGDQLERGKKLSLCRCWRSETFPLCDGAHKEHNRNCCDNIGPVDIVWGEDIEDLVSKTLVEDIQSMNASTDEPLSSLEMIDSNGSGDNGSADSDSHSNDGNNCNKLIDI